MKKKKSKKNSILDKIKKFYKDHTIEVRTALIVLAIGLIGIILFLVFNNNSSIKKVNEEQYSFEYDNTWSLKNKKEDNIVLKHNSGSKVTIDITKLADDYKYSSIDELIDEIIYNINTQNKSYNIISNKKSKLTKFEYDGYKLLYENDDEQIMICTFKKSDKLIIIRYEATDDYFDILLDSAQNIIYNLNIKDSSYNLTNKIEVQTKAISYSTDEDIDKKLDETSEYEIANNHFKVKYKIPTIFELSSFNTLYNYFRQNIDDYTTGYAITTSVYNYNIYEYIEKDNVSGIYSNSTNYRKEDSKYSNFEDSLSEIEGDRLGYVYFYSFDEETKKLNSKNMKYEDVTIHRSGAEVVYALDNNHIFRVQISETELPITEKLINSVKVIEANNYASNITVEKEDESLIGTLKRYTDYERNKIEYVTIKIPDKYIELDKGQNMYEERYYGLNYNEELDLYDYKVSYEVVDFNRETELGIIGSKSSGYGESNDLQYVGDLTVNDKNFSVYSGGYIDISGIMFTSINRVKYYVNRTVLFYEIPDRGNLVIEINGNGKEITDEIIQEVTNFTIDVKEK